MIKKWIGWINFVLCCAIATIAVVAAIFMWQRPRHFSLLEETVRKSTMPKGSFAHTQSDYDAIGVQSLSLTFSPLSVQLPDLRRYLVYYGKNGRPDADPQLPVMYFAFTGNKTPTPVSPGKPVFIMYDKKLIPNQYVFSPENVETPLWILARSIDKQAQVKVEMKAENGQIINEPTAYAEFSLPEKEFIRFGGAAWEIGNWRVDGTLLARQKAKWFGIDRFLEKHGGDEFKNWQKKQRIDFGEGEDLYSVYVGQSDCLIWKNNRWFVTKAGESSLNYPIMCVKKIDERIMNFELWDVDGKGKMVLNLIKNTESWLPQNLEQAFKFVGARTRSQFVFEINHERFLLSPHDWLVYTESGWMKLSNPKEIDDYVDRKIIGPLFVFDQIERKDDRQVILGTFFSAGRTEMASVELPLQQQTSPPGKALQDEKKQKIKESNPRPMINTGENLRHPPNEPEQDDDEDQE